MILPRLYEALSQLENFHEAGGGVNVSCKCGFCGGSRSDPNEHSLSIKIDVEPGEPIWYQCFRASCGAKGALTSTTLQELGITDMDVLAEVAAHNKGVKGKPEKAFQIRKGRDYVLANLPIKSNLDKIDYVNRRLGTKLDTQGLTDLKIQLSILELLRINEIRKISVNENYLQKLDDFCVGFISMFSDYMICRDITPDMKTGMRYYSYRISGRPDPNDLKIYCIPCTIDLMDPHSAIINVAEGPFSILGAYLNTDLGRDKPNSIWLANCGAQYTNTILRVCKQYGLLRVHINIWSDSEIKMGMYQKLYRTLKNRMDIRKMSVLYNDASDDFGHPKHNIKIREVTII